jgi:hypothetical protein
VLAELVDDDGHVGEVNALQHVLENTHRQHKTAQQHSNTATDIHVAEHSRTAHQHTLSMVSWLTMGMSTKLMFCSTCSKIASIRSDRKLLTSARSLQSAAL